MKSTQRFFILFLLSLFLLPLLPAQPVVVFQYRHVPAENVGEFVHRETTYWSEVAQNAIKEGKMSYWALYQKVGGWELPGGSNFLFINVFEGPSALDNMGGVWDPSAVFPDARAKDMETNSLGTVNHQVVIRGVAGEGDGKPNFIRINYSKASDMAKYLELEQSVWQPFIKEQIESKNTTQISWRLGQLIMPAGTDLPFNAITVDTYSKMSEAVFPGTSFKEAPEFPDLAGLNEVHEKVYIQVYALVKDAE